MKKKYFFILSLIGILLMLVGYPQLSPSNQTKAEAKSLWTVQAELNNNLTQDLLERKNIVENSKEKMGYEMRNKETKGKLTINFNKREIDESNPNYMITSGEGIVKINEHTFPITFENMVVEKLKINENIVYTSNIISEIKSKNSKYEDVALTLFWNPKNDKVQASITLGNLGNYALAFYGENFVTYDSLENVEKVPFK